MIRDFYAEAAHVAQALLIEGLADEAESLRGAVASGATATEILMGIRWHLRGIERANRVRDKATTRMVRELLAELEKALP
jgi:hypothetical protein